MSTRALKGITMAEINEKLSEIKAETTDITQTLRGHNGNPGLVSKVERIDERVGNQEKTIGSILNSVGEIASLRSDMREMMTMLNTINTRGCEFSQTSGVHDEKEGKPKEGKPKEDKSDEDQMKWSELRQRLFWPVVVAIVIAVIMAIPTFVIFYYKLQPLLK